MKYIISLTIGIMTCLASIYGQSDLVDRIQFADIDQGTTLLVTEDAFTQSWSRFDIDSRLHKPNSTKKELLDFIIDQVRDWTPEEQERIRAVVLDIQAQLTSEDIHLQLPEEIFLVKTTMAEEGNAGAYTRANYIVMGTQLMTMSDDDIKHVFLHELFHVLSRNNPALREAMYSIIGFSIMDPIDYPDLIKDHRITNPDAPQTDHFITLQVHGQDIPCMMVLYADRPYDEGEFFQYLNVGFLQLSSGSPKKPVYKDDLPIIHGMGDVTGFFEQIGKNTQYIIHPEEIMADNFSYALLGKPDLANPEIIEQIKLLLRK